MNKRFASVLLFAFVVSVGASLLLYRLVSSRLTADAKAPVSQIVVAARQLEVGALIKDMDLRTADWTGALPHGATMKKEDIVGRGVVATIYDGEPIVDSRLASVGAGAGLAATIPMGMRAVAVRVNEVVGVAGFVTPGMRVDVLISGSPPGESRNSGTLTKTLLQSIEVLSAGQKIEKNSEGRPESVNVVNLLVTPEQAETLSLASSETRIQLVLRNPLDTEETKTSGSAVASLFKNMPVRNEGAPPPAPRPKPKVIARVAEPAPMTIERITVPVTIEVIHGAKRAQTKFAEGSDMPDNSDRR